MLKKYIWLVRVTRIGNPPAIPPEASLVRTSCSLRVTVTTLSRENSLKLGNPFFAPMIQGTP